MRGANVLFADFFADEKPVDKQVKGRSPELNSLRNDLLIHRFYYYGSQTPKLRYDYILELLSKEFFLSVEYLPKIIGENYPALCKLHQERPAIILLAKKWPHLKW